MELTFTKEVEEKVNIQLPCFVKYGSNYWKILDNTTVVKLGDYSFDRGIDVKDLMHDNPFKLTGYEIIDEKEFNRVFNKVLAMLNQPEAYSKPYNEELV